MRRYECTVIGTTNYRRSMLIDADGPDSAAREAAKSEGRGIRMEYRGEGESLSEGLHSKYVGKLYGQFVTVLVCQPRGDR